MNKTHYDRKAFIDRLEKKYIKKVQLRAFRHESEMIKNELNALRGTKARRMDGQDFEFLDLGDRRAIYL
jgi:hypothetical protein